MRYLVSFLLGFLMLSCNEVGNEIGEVVDKVKMITKETITVEDYHYVVDSKNRRGFVTSDNEIMNGHYLVVKDNLPLEEFQIKDGFLHGFHVQFDEEGAISVKSNYAHSYLEGPSISYYKNGAIKNEVSYKYNKKVGDETSYDLNGNITYKKTKVNGQDYEKFYDQGKHLVSQFEKTIDGVAYDLIVKLDNFENIEIVFGRVSGDEKTPDLYVFNANFELIEKINPKENPQRAMQYMSLFRGTDITF